MRPTTTDISLQTELGQWLKNPAPRTLTPRLRKHLGKASGLWATSIFGLLFGGFGGVFCIFFVPWQLLNERALDKAPPHFVEGKVTHIEKLNMSINKVAVWSNEVTFPYQQQKRTSVGYTTGKHVKEGENVFVRVHPKDPNINCPQGMRMSKASAGSALVLLFPLVGFSLIIFPWLARKKRFKLYENGTVAEVRVLSVMATNMQVNNHYVHKICLQFPHIPETIEVKKTDPHDVASLIEALELEKPLRVVYDPQKPKRFVACGY